MDDYRQKYIQYAWDLTHNLDFIATIEYESTRNPQRTCDIKGEDSKWLCQRNMNYYPEVRKDPNFNDPYRQIRTCWEKYKVLKDPGTIFHGYSNRSAVIGYFTLR